MKRFLLLALLLLSCVRGAKASDFYYANAAAGSNNGTNCANAFAWNDGTNGLNISAKQAAGNNLHLCGVITLGTSATLVTFINNGSSGNPITLIWESGADVKATYCSSNGCVIADGRSFITVDGGTNGILENTGNGDQLSNQLPSTGVHATTCTNCIVKNLSINNIFIHTAPVNITSITGNGTTATVTCAATCGLVTGEKFHVSNNANGGFNGDFVVASTSGTTLTYLNATNATGAGGSLGCSFGPNPACVDHTALNAVQVSGTNNLVTNLKTDMCGWCIKDAYGNLDDNNTFSFNEVSNFDHCLTYAESLSNDNSTNIFMFGNKCHDAASYDTPNCSGHHDGLHTFGSGASNYGYTGFWFHDNDFYGNWGACSTGAIFVEGGSNAHANNQFFWNNTVRPTYAASFVNTNGWFSVFSGVGGVTQVFNNSVKVAGTADLTVCFNIGSTNNTTIKNNIGAGCGGHGNFGNFTGTTVIDYNQWDTKNDGGGNCWIIQGSFTGCTFANYKAACVTPFGSACDTHGRQDTFPLALNADTTPQGTFPGIKWGDNLGSLATGNMSGLGVDTSLGNTRTQLSRPATASCTSQGSLPCWDIGAAQFGAAGPAPSGTTVIIAAYPVPTLTPQPVVTSISPTKTYVTPQGCSQDGQKKANPCIFTILCSSCDGATAVTLDGQSVVPVYLNGVITVSVPLSLLPVPTQITSHNFTLTNPTSIPPLAWFRPTVPYAFRQSGT